MMMMGEKAAATIREGARRPSPSFPIQDTASR